MVDYRRGAHTVFEMHLHLVWITKYRRPALSGEVATRVRDLIRDICAQQEVNIMKGHVAKDHVHLFVSIPKASGPENCLRCTGGLLTTKRSASASACTRANSLR